MKFEFCGRLDCPDWILAQLFHASHLELGVFELIAENVNEAIKSGGQVDEAKMLESLYRRESENQKERLKETRLDLEGSYEDFFDIDEVRACFAALHYIITNACQFKVSPEQLETELEQLGLPGDHCQILCHLVMVAHSSRDFTSGQV